MSRLIPVAVALTLVALACGDDGDTAAAPATAAPTTTTTTAAPTTTTTTAAPTTTTTAAPTTTLAGIIPGQDEEVDAVVLAFSTVFDSETTYEDKVPFLDDASGLEETVAKYTATGNQIGRVTILPEAVEISDGAAVITYTILFSGNPTYDGQTGELTLGDAGWEVPREVFCTLMKLARVGCP